VLTIADRIEISTGVKAGWGVRSIARHLGRDPGVISREIARNRNADGTYRAVGADVKAERRRARPKARKVAACEVLRARVLADLRESRTPRQIAGRLRLEATGASVELMPNSLPADGHVASHEAIYQFIYAMPRAQLVKHGVFLQSKRTRRHPRPEPGSRTKRAPIVGMRSISERELGALERRVPGHWEGDLIIGKNGASCAITLVERMSRYVTILACPMGKDSASIADVPHRTHEGAAGDDARVFGVGPRQ